MAFGNELMRIRYSLEMTAAELAVKTRLTPAAISMI